MGGLGLALLAGCATPAARAPAPHVVAISSSDPSPSPSHDTPLSPVGTLELITEDASRVQHQLIFARSRHDARRAACLDEKLSELHADNRNATDQVRDLKRARAENDAMRTRERRVMIDVLRQRAENLTRQADRCGAAPGGAGVVRPDPLTRALKRARTAAR